MDYLQQLQEWSSQRGSQDDFITFQKILKSWQKSPYPLDDFYTQVAPLLGNELHLIAGMKEWIPGKFQKVIAKAEKAKANQDAAEQSACEIQSASPLLTLPRELRDKIWGFVSTDNIIHISQGIETQAKRRGRNVRRKKYNFYMCSSPYGYASTACPPGIGDHTYCSTSGGSNYGDWRLACRQMYYEMPYFQEDFLVKNALQFADLETADAFLFNLKEVNRASIRHLRISVPYSLTKTDNVDRYESARNPWVAICNYFSNPWDRKTLHMKAEGVYDLRKPIYFYYSSCYYQHNSNRLYKRWQVGRGGTSWDIGISDLVYIGCPRLDIAMENATPEELEDERLRSHSPFSMEFNHSPPVWLHPLLQFRNYDSLNFSFYGPQADTLPTEVKEARMNWLVELKNFVRGGPEGLQGPQICAFFAGHPYGNGDSLYNYG